MTSPAAWATCTSCRSGFAYDPGFYRERVLLPPRVCRPCREQRASRVVTLSATVDRVDRTFIFARAGDGARFFVAPACVAADVGELRVGDPILLDVDPAAPVAPGRKPRALRVRRP